MIEDIDLEKQIVLSPLQREILACRSFQMVPLPSGARRFAAALLALVVFVVMALAFVPWQQVIIGRGRVIIYSPMERPQNLEAQIPGRIVRWYVRDGVDVHRGDVIVTLSEVDPEFLDPRMQERLETQKEALVAKRDAAQARFDALGQQLAFAQNSRQVAIPQAKERFRQAGDRIVAAKQALKASEQNLLTANLNLVRRNTLYEKGLRSKRDLELAELDQVSAQAEVEKARALLGVAQKDQSVMDFEYARTTADTGASVNAIQAAKAAAQETVATTQAEIQKIDVQVAAIHRRIEQRTVRAPIAGRVVRLLKVGGGETVASGAVLAVIAPKTEDLACELVVSGNDAPLVTPGRRARLQFAGWPALQFTGWPSVAVGTFAGIVKVVDQIDDGRGNYRLIILPDHEMVEERMDEPWPSSRFLRPGSEVTGWVMLKVVPLGYELWRQFNAFPPTIDRPEPGGVIRPEDAAGKENPLIKLKSK